MEPLKTAIFGELWHSFPRGGHSDLVKQLGGQLSDAVPPDADDSALRLSVSFNRTGHPIPRSSSYGARDVTDSNGFKYVTSPDEMGNLLESKLGKPRNLKTQADAIGRRGIILFEHCRSLHGGSHVELWDGETTALPTGDFFTEAQHMKLWELKEN